MFHFFYSNYIKVTTLWFVVWYIRTAKVNIMFNGILAFVIACYNIIIQDIVCVYGYIDIGIETNTDIPGLVRSLWCINHCMTSMTGHYQADVDTLPSLLQIFLTRREAKKHFWYFGRCGHIFNILMLYWKFSVGHNITVSNFQWSRIPLLCCKAWWSWMHVISFTELCRKNVVVFAYCFYLSISSMRFDYAYMHLWIEW